MFTVSQDLYLTEVASFQLTVGLDPQVGNQACLAFGLLDREHAQLEQACLSPHVTGWVGGAGSARHCRGRWPGRSVMLGLQYEEVCRAVDE